MEELKEEYDGMVKELAEEKAMREKLEKECDEKYDKVRKELSFEV